MLFFHNNKKTYCVHPLSYLHTNLYLHMYTYIAMKQKFFFEIWIEGISQARGPLNHIIVVVVVVWKGLKMWIWQSIALFHPLFLFSSPSACDILEAHLHRFRITDVCGKRLWDACSTQTDGWSMRPLVSLSLSLPNIQWFWFFKKKIRCSQNKADYWTQNKSLDVCIHICK